MPNVLISEFMDNAVAEGVISEFDVHWDPGFWGKRDELPQLFRCARDIVGRNVTMEGPEIPEAASQLKIGRADGSWARQYQRGINAETCGMPGVEDCPAIGANGVSVAKHVLTTATFAAPDVPAGIWDRPKFADATGIGERTTGIMGFCSVSRVVGAKARGKGTEEIACDAN